MKLVLPVVAAIVLTLALVLSLIPRLTPGAPRGALQCWQRTATGPEQWELIGDQAKNIETCAGYIEALRTEKLKVQELVGGYQGWYLVARPDGIYYTRNLKKFPVRALVRTSNGRLAAPGQVDVCYSGQGATQHKIADKLKLGDCVELLFDKVCLQPGESTYGAWQGTTLRLQGDRVQQAGLDGAYRELLQQRQPGCRLPVAD